MPIRFDNPHWLWLLMVMLPAAWLAVRWFLTMTRLRRNSAILARALVLAAIASLLAGAVSIQRTNKLAVVVVLDVSDSVRLFGVQPNPVVHDAQELKTPRSTASDGSVKSPVSHETGQFVQAVPGTDIIDRTRAFLAAATAKRSADDLLGVVVFGGAAMAVATPSAARVLDRPLDVSLARGTNIQAALAYAAALIPADATGRLLLVSDGNETAGNADAAAGALASRLASRAFGAGVESSTPGRSAIPIDVLPVQYDLQNEVLVEGVDLPPTAVAESTIAVRVQLRSSGVAQGTLHLMLDKKELDIVSTAPLRTAAVHAGSERSSAISRGRRLTLEPGAHIEVVQVKLPPGRVHRFRAIWEPRSNAVGIGTDRAQSATEVSHSSRFVGDTLVENNQSSGVVITPGQGQVLFVDGVGEGSQSGRSSALVRMLEAAGIRVSVIAPEALPEDLVSLQEYDTVIFQDVSADAVSDKAQHALKAHITDIGAGFIMLGGRNSFAPGGWRGSTLEPLLPVNLQVPDDLVVPTAAVMLVLDSSGSMGWGVGGSLRTKQEIANESAAQAIATLDSKDLIGVLSFDNATHTVIALGPNTDPIQAAQRVRSITASGGTNIGPALREAKKQLEGVDAQIKYVILLSDGQSQDAARLPELARQLGDAGIKITTISVGEKADLGTMARIAQVSNGKHYAVHNPNVLPRIFIKAIRVVRTPMVREIPFVPIIASAGSPLVEGLGGLPALGGLVMTQERIDPTITTALVSSKNEPVLASWRVGLGQVAAFTSDARSDGWGRKWADWPGYSLFWTRLVRTVSRPTTPGPYQLSITNKNGKLVLGLDAQDKKSQPIDYLHVPATVYAASGQSQSVVLEQIAPGRYEAALDLDTMGDAAHAGNIVAVVKPSLGQTKMPPIVGGISIQANEEFRTLQSNDVLLMKLAKATGGRVLAFDKPLRADLYDRTKIPPRITSVPIFLPLMAAVLGLFLFDVATRRVAWDRFVSREFGASLSSAAALATHNRSEQAARAIASLGKHHASNTLSSDQPQAALGNDTASQVVRQARKRRAREEADRLETIRNSMLAKPARNNPAEEATKTDSHGSIASASTTHATHATNPATQQEPNDPGDTTNSLLAAKERARKRFESHEEDQS